MSQDDEPRAYKEWRRREKKLLEFVEDVTSRPREAQEHILEHILRKNADTQYLRKCGMDGATDVKSFRQHVPVSQYDAYKPYIDRILQGDKSPLLSGDPVVQLMRSSGTSGGEPKIYPITAEELELRGAAWNLMRPFLNRALPGLEKGKVMFFYFIRQPNVSQGGLLCHSAVSSFAKSSSFLNRPFDPSYRLTSPEEVIGCYDHDSAMYCHLLLGLLQREEVFRFGAIFASVIQTALRDLEDLCEEICEDIANGTLSSRVKDESVRSAVLPMLRKDPELADFVRSQFGPGKSLDGIIRRLWPNVKVIDTVCTGAMEHYLPALANYSENLPVICSQLYAATEGYFGVNLNPVCPPEEITYTLLPSFCYFEFRAIAGNAQGNMGKESDEILDLVSLKEGQEYELLVTTISGLYRYRMGDILKVVGFYNAAPVFRFMRRMSTILSIDMDKTDEGELQTAVGRGAKVLERELGLRLSDYTSTVDLSSRPGHYVVFWELVPRLSQTPAQEVLQLCCSVMEAALNHIYRRGRHESTIGALELRLVQQGTFNLLADHAVSQGANLSQYKTPRGLGPNRSAFLGVLNSRVYQSVFSQEKPPFTPAIFPQAPVADVSSEMPPLTVSC